LCSTLQTSTKPQQNLNKKTSAKRPQQKAGTMTDINLSNVSIDLGLGTESILDVLSSPDYEQMRPLTPLARARDAEARMVTWADVEPKLSVPTSEYTEHIPEPLDLQSDLYVPQYTMRGTDIVLTNPKPGTKVEPEPEPIIYSDDPDEQLKGELLAKRNAKPSFTYEQIEVDPSWIKPPQDLVAEYVNHLPADPMKYEEDVFRRFLQWAHPHLMAWLREDDALAARYRPLHPSVYYPVTDTSTWEEFRIAAWYNSQMLVRGSEYYIDFCSMRSLLSPLLGTVEIHGSPVFRFSVMLKHRIALMKKHYRKHEPFKHNYLTKKINQKNFKATTVIPKDPIAATLPSVDPEGLDVLASGTPQELRNALLRKKAELDAEWTQITTEYARKRARELGPLERALHALR